MGELQELGFCHFLFRACQHGSCSWTCIRTGTVGSRSFSLGQANWTAILQSSPSNPNFPLNNIFLVFLKIWVYCRDHYESLNFVDWLNSAVFYDLICCMTSFFSEAFFKEQTYKNSALQLTSRDWGNSKRLYSLYGSWRNAYNNVMYFIWKAQAWRSLRLLT